MFIIIVNCFIFYVYFYIIKKSLFTRNMLLLWFMDCFRHQNCQVYIIFVYFLPSVLGKVGEDVFILWFLSRRFQVILVLVWIIIYQSLILPKILYFKTLKKISLILVLLVSKQWVLFDFFEKKIPYFFNNCQEVSLFTDISKQRENKVQKKRCRYSLPSPTFIYLFIYLW